MKLFGKVIISEYEYEKLKKIRNHDEEISNMFCDYVDRTEDFTKEIKKILEDNMLFEIEKAKEIKKLVDEFEKDTN